MREEWKEVEIGEVITTKKGYAFKSQWYLPKGRPIVRVSDFTDDSISTTDIKYIDQDLAQTLIQYKLDFKDVIIQTVGSWQHNPASIVGKVIKVPKELKNALLNQNAVKLVPNSKIDKSFLYFRLRDESFKFHNLNFAQGAANQASITLDTIKRFKISLPNLETQQKIASILSGYDDLIENNLKRIKLLEEIAKQTYEEWFVRMRFPGYETAVINEVSGLPAGWELKTLNEVSVINAKSIKKDFEGYIKYIDISSVSTKNIDYTTDYEISLAPGRAKRIVRHGDIIWSCVRPNRRSYSLIWNPDVNTIASTGFCVITPVSIPSSYLYQLLTTDSFVGRLTSLAGGAAYPAVKAEDFANSEIILPNKVLLEKYHKISEPNLDVISNLKIQNRRLKEARDILLPRLMTGIIKV